MLDAKVWLEMGSKIAAQNAAMLYRGKAKQSFAEPELREMLTQMFMAGIRAADNFIEGEIGEGYLVRADPAKKAVMP